MGCVRAYYGLTRCSNIGYLPFLTTGPFDQATSSPLRLHNPHHKPIVVKIKVTSPKAYCVRPNSSRIEPGETIEISGEYYGWPIGTGRNLVVWDDGRERASPNMLILVFDSLCLCRRFLFPYLFCISTSAGRLTFNHLPVVLQSDIVLELASCSSADEGTTSSTR